VWEGWGQCSGYQGWARGQLMKETINQFIEDAEVIEYEKKQKGAGK